ncbi:MAG: hypothetical protein R3C10_20390 [Pirellulales bacterium]
MLRLFVARRSTWARCCTWRRGATARADVAGAAVCVFGRRELVDAVLILVTGERTLDPAGRLGRVEQLFQERPTPAAAGPGAEALGQLAGARGDSTRRKFSSLRRLT